MERDTQKSIYTLLALFGVLIGLIVIFMQTGDITPSVSLSSNAEKPIQPTAPSQPPTKKDSVQSNAIPPAVNQFASQVSNEVTLTQAEQDELDQYDIKEPASQMPRSLTGNACALEEGAHNATVQYSDPETGRSSTYKLDVVVLNCQVIAIDFRKGEWLDHDNFRAADIDAHGNASVEDDRRRLFDIHINK